MGTCQYMEVGGEGVCASNLVTLISAKQRVPVHSIGRKVEWKAWLQDMWCGPKL